MARRAWIIGASSGIGAALAREMAAQGWELTLSARDHEALEVLAKECGGAEVRPLDLGVRGDLARAAEGLSGLDAIVSTAALYDPGRVEDIDETALEALIAVNLGSLFPLAKLAPKILREGGQLILFGSVAGYLGLPRGQPYSATKAAVANLAETLRVELAPRVDVRLVSPGFVRTRLTDKNSFAMPAILSAEAAAKEVMRGMQRRGFEIHFPPRFTLAMKLLRLLPYSISLRLTARLGRLS